MILLELNGSHIGRKAEISWKFNRKNAKQHKYVGYILNINHRSADSSITLSRISTEGYFWAYKILPTDTGMTAPYYAEVKLLDE